MKGQLYLIIFCCSIGITMVQKLPNVQTGSLRAPVAIKIDGQISEWDNKLQAHNSVDDIRYTISNDDENLYLTLVAPYKEPCRKALRAGITFSISKFTDKKRKGDKNIKAITFPLSKNAQNLEMASKLGEYLEYTGKTNKDEKKRDSMLTLINRKATAIFSTIDIDGKVVPVNKLEIRSCAQFNKNMDFVYELSIPLKYCGFDINYTVPFSYNIRLNEQREERKIDYSIPAPTPPPGITPPPPDIRFLPTDFRGEYTLAKKP